MPTLKPDSPLITAPKRSRGAPKGIRITDVAASAGVSPITVSRVFNAPQTVAPETLLRVRQAVQELGYVPNRLAGGLSSAKSRLIAAIVPTVAHSLFSETVQIFSDTMSRAGYQVLLGLSGYSDEDEDQLLDAVLSRRPEGVLLTGVAHTATLRERLLKIGIPIVETWDMTEHPIDMLVGFSHYRIGVAVAERFIARGARHLALVSANDARALARRRGFIDTLRAQGRDATAEVLVTPPSSVALGRDATRADPRAVSCRRRDLLQFGLACAWGGVAGEKARHCDSRAHGGVRFRRPRFRRRHDARAHDRARRRQAHRCNGGAVLDRAAGWGGGEDGG